MRQLVRRANGFSSLEHKVHKILRGTNHIHCPRHRHNTRNNSILITPQKQKMRSPLNLDSSFSTPSVNALTLTVPLFFCSGGPLRPSHMVAVHRMPTPARGPPEKHCIQGQVATKNILAIRNIPYLNCFSRGPKMRQNATYFRKSSG